MQKLRNGFALLCITALMSCGVNAPVSTTTTTTEDAASAAAPTTSVVAQSELPAGALVVAKGVVIPEQTAVVQFAPGRDGRITEILVEEGDTIRAGDPIARIDSRQLALDINAAELRLNQARLRSEEIKAGPLDEQVALNQTRIELARTELRNIQTDLNEQDVIAANESLAASQQSLSQLQNGPRPEDQQSAQAELDLAKAELQQIRDQLSAHKTDLKLLVERRANDVRTSQDDYSRIYWRNRNLENDRDLHQIEIDEEANALRQIENAQTLLAAAQVDYEEALKAEASRIAQGEARVTNAQAQLEKLINGPEQSDLTAAQAIIARNAADLKRITGDNRQAAIDNARTRLAEAEASLALLMASPTENAVAQSDLAVLLAELELKQAQLNLEDATLRAPMDGTIAVLSMRIGDSTQGSYAEIADYTSWRIVTNTLTELDVVRIREGGKAKLTFVALPELDITGTVEHVRMVANEDGSLGYQAIIAPDTWDDRLQWNMSVSVVITL